MKKEKLKVMLVPNGIGCVCVFVAALYNVNKNEGRRERKRANRVT